MQIDPTWAWNTLGIPGLLLAIAVPTIRAVFVVWKDSIVPVRIEAYKRTAAATERQAAAFERIADLAQLTREDVAATRQDVGALRVEHAKTLALQEAQAAQAAAKPQPRTRRLKVANAATGDRS